MAHPGSLGQLIGDFYFNQDEPEPAEKPSRGAQPMESQSLSRWRRWRLDQAGRQIAFAR